MVWRPCACSAFSTRLAIVDLPDADSPVNHSTAGFCPISPARACLSTSSRCQWMLLAPARRSVTMPAPTVLRVSRSIRMKPPSSRLTA